MAKARIKPRRAAAAMAAACALFLIAAPSAAAQGRPAVAGLMPGLPAESLARIRGGAIDAREAAGPADLRWLPAGAPGAAIRAAIAGRQAWPVLIESAYLIPAAELPAYDGLKALNALGAVSTMSGITYFSHNRNRETVLFDEVFKAEGPGSRKALPDPGYRALPAADGFTVHLKDANFGSSWYAATLQADERGARLGLTNARAMGIAVVRAFGAGDLVMEFYLAPVDEGLLVYGLCAAAPANLASSVVDMYSAVLKRLDSVRLWAVGRLKAAR